MARPHYRHDRYPLAAVEKRGFDHLFDELLCGPQVADLQAADWLCDARTLLPPLDQRIIGGEVDRTGGFRRIYMDYFDVKDLKKPRELWEKLASERELVITRDGKPSALMISVSPETVEESLREIRRALLSAAVSRVRKRAETEGIPDDKAISAEIDQSRKDRGLRCRSEPKG